MNRDAVLWLAIAGGPLAWMLSFGANWSIVWWACIWHWTPGQFVMWFLAMAVCVGCAFTAWKQWQQLGPAAAGETGGAIARARALALGGMMLSAASFLVMLAQTLITAMMGACE